MIDDVLVGGHTLIAEFLRRLEELRLSNARHVDISGFFSL